MYIFFNLFIIFIHCTVLDPQLRLVRCPLLAEDLPSARYFIDTLIKFIHPSVRPFVRSFIRSFIHFMR